MPCSLHERGIRRFRDPGLTAPRRVLPVTASFRNVLSEGTICAG